MTKIDLNQFGDERQRAIYATEMEQLGEDVVQMRLANRMAIGNTAEGNPPPAFAIYWLGQRAAARKASDNRRYRILATVALVSAIAAVIAAIPVIGSWLQNSPKP